MTDGNLRESGCLRDTYRNLFMVLKTVTMHKHNRHSTDTLLENTA